MGTEKLELGRGKLRTPSLFTELKLLTLTNEFMVLDFYLLYGGNPRKITREGGTFLSVQFFMIDSFASL